MNERESKTITTPGGRTVVLKTYLTGRESNDLKSLIFGALNISTEDAAAGNLSVEKISGTLVLEQEKKALELLAVAIDGSTEDVVNKILDLASAEYEFVIAEVNRIRSPFQGEK